MSGNPEQKLPRRKILVTGSEGFMGRNLCLALQRHGGFEVAGFDRADSSDALPSLAARAELVFHLAGVNRPQDLAEFAAGNARLTRCLCEALAAAGGKAPLVLSSSVQAELDNPYGASKRAAEEAVLDYHDLTGCPVYVFRFPNVFGKWSQPNYNTVVATFCYNLARGLPVQVNDRTSALRFVHIDDIVRAFLEIAERRHHNAAQTRYEIQPIFTLSLGDLHDRLQFFEETRRKGLVADLADPLTRYLYSTFVSFLPPQELSMPVEMKTDERGWLFELLKSPHAGQVFVSRTKPGVTRGNHYHDTKIEKFAVIEGEAIIRLRDLRGGSPLEYPVDGREIRIVDIPPGYTHSIQNTGQSDLITLFWANEIFDPQRPDTWTEKVFSQS